MIQRTMAERLTKERRSWNMSRIRSRDTRPEILVRSLLHRMGFRFRLHVRALPGRPDIVLPHHRTVIFVHGCFWHQHQGCVDGKRPATRTGYWEPKLARNVTRDTEHRAVLRALGWKVIVIWECEALRPEVLRNRVLSEPLTQDQAIAKKGVPSLAPNQRKRYSRSAP